jgi:GNAT superfamily N-acetyltransferase
MSRSKRRELRFEPADREHWDDLEELFGKRGACGGCWCMFWRLRRKEFEANKGAGNRQSLKRIVTRGRPPGILAYSEDEVIGWCAVAPRAEYIALETSRILKPIDDEPVWSISCLFVKKGYRRKGISSQLLRAAIKFAKGYGATVVEGYPTEPASTTMPDPFLWHGIASSFVAAGFKEVLRRSATRPIMRFQIR